MRAPLLLIFMLVTVLARGAERDVTTFNAAGGITLAGTLSVPDERKPRGVIVMVTGSGAQDRDETIMGHRPFKTLADSLAANGWATLRMDDRGTGQSTGKFEGATTADFITDVAATVAAADSIFPDLPLGILGHSEGGQIAYRMAGNPSVDFIVTLAAPAWPGDSIIMSQTRALAVAQTGRWDREDTQRQLLNIVKSDLPTLYARIAVTDVMRQALGDAMTLPAVAEQVNAQVDALLSPWYRAFIKYNPADDITDVAVPWLALNGERDTQVLPANLDTIASLNPRAVTVLLPGLNHLFQQCVSGLVTEYAGAGPTMTAPVTSQIIQFLNSLP